MPTGADVRCEDAGDDVPAAGARGFPVAFKKTPTVSRDPFQGPLLSAVQHRRISFGSFDPHPQIPGSPSSRGNSCHGDSRSQIFDPIGISLDEGLQRYTP